MSPRRGAALLVCAWLAGCATLAGDEPAQPVAAAPEPAVILPRATPNPDREAAIRAQQRADALARLDMVIDDEDALRGQGAEALSGRVFDNLWDRIRAGFAMPELNTRLVAEKERFYLERPDYLQRMMQRGGRYLFHIVEELEKRKMPTELALLPFVESAMNPTALSTAQASGLWQFIPSTGRAYNLQQDWWVDNRRDVVKSTQAALDYLQKIYEMHGNDWFLALASYNWGEGAVARAIKLNKARNQPTDYLSLNMPNETRHYVPKLIGLKNILMRAEELGLALPELPNRPYFVTIEKSRPIDLKLAAQFAGMSVEEFLELNPAHHRPVITASRNNEIKLPADRLDAFLEAVERHASANRAFATWQPYTLKPGESLDAIATRSGITGAELRRANGLRANSRILAGTRLLIPQHSVDDERKVEDFQGPRIYEQVEQSAAWHQVAAGESLQAIARRYRLSVAQIRTLNPGLAGEPAKGSRLVVRQAGTQTILITESGQRSVVEAPAPRTPPPSASVASGVAPGATAGAAPAQPPVATPQTAKPATGAAQSAQATPATAQSARPPAAAAPQAATAPATAKPAASASSTAPKATDANAAGTRAVKPAGPPPVSSTGATPAASAVGATPAASTPTAPAPASAAATPATRKASTAVSAPAAPGSASDDTQRKAKPDRST